MKDVDVNQGAGWVTVSVEAALQSRAPARCPQCKGRVRLHQAGPGESSPAHAEHLEGNSQCPRSVYFTPKYALGDLPAAPPQGEPVRYQSGPDHAWRPDGTRVVLVKVQGRWHRTPVLIPPTEADIRALFRPFDPFVAHGERSAVTASLPCEEDPSLTPYWRALQVAILRSIAFEEAAQIVLAALETQGTG